MRSKDAKDLTTGDVVAIEDRWRPVDQVAVYADEVGIYTDGITKAAFIRHPHDRMRVR